MKETEKIKDYADHFRVFSLYFGMEYEDCKQAMRVYFTNLTNSSNPRYSDLKVNGWWDTPRKPNKNELPKINAFFSEMAANQNNKHWKKEWLFASLAHLEKDELLKEEVEKIKQPYATARFFAERYASSTLLGEIIRKYCHNYFYIFRIHISTGELVRDLLRFQGHDNEWIFCTLYQYTKHHIKGMKSKNIKEFSGNIFFNDASFDITCVSKQYDQEQGPQYGKILFPRLHENDEQYGIMSALSDQAHAPAAAKILVRSTKIKSQINPEKLKDYVKVIKPRDINDYDLIMKALAGQAIVVDQSSKR